VLTLLDGTRVETVDQWGEIRRNEILELFRENVYGRVPRDVAVTVKSIILEESADALNGKALRRQVRLYLKNEGEEPFIDVLVYLPKAKLQANSVVPIFAGLNFHGNHTVTNDDKVAVHQKWVRNDQRIGQTNHRASEAGRGKNAGRWQVEMLIDNGFGLATAYYGDIDPDFDDDWENGIHSIFASSKKLQGGDWGAIASWSWGLSKMMDYFEKDDQIDHDRVALTG